MDDRHPIGNRHSIIPIASGEPLWEWRVESDELYLSRGAMAKLGFPSDAAPATMASYIAHIDPSHLPGVHKDMEAALSGDTCEVVYPFGGFYVRKQVVVLDRDDCGRGTHVMGRYIAVGSISDVRKTVKKDDSVKSGYWYCSLKEGKLFLDATCMAMIGRGEEPATLSLAQWKEMLHPEEGIDGVCRYKSVFDEILFGDSIEDTLRLHTPEGKYVKVSTKGSVIERDESGVAVSVSGHMVPFREDTPEGEHDSGRLLFAINAAGDGLWDWDAVTDKVYFSPRYLSMLGYNADEFPGHLDVWKEKIHPDDYRDIVPPQAKIVSSPMYGDTFECTYRLMKADGTWAWILGRGYVTNRDENGMATRLVGLHTDISNSQAGRERLEDLVKNDILTGLHSRAYCDMEIERIEKNKIRPLSIIACDINGLKLTNDYMGHAIGDKLLCTAAMLLRHTLRSTDCVARIGGDEFLIILPGCTYDDGHEIMCNIERNLIRYNSSNCEIPVFISLGVASTSSLDVPASKIITEADRNMFSKKLAERPTCHRMIKTWIETCLGYSISMEDERYDCA